MVYHAFEWWTDGYVPAALHMLSARRSTHTRRALLVRRIMQKAQPANCKPSTFQGVTTAPTCDYADPKMWLIIIPTVGGDANSIMDEMKDEELEETAEALSEGACPDTPAGTTLKPAAAGSCWMLVNDGASDESSWPVDTTGLNGVAMFAQHVPTEFELTKHFYKDSTGEDIEPVDYSKRWGEAIGASFIVNLVTLIGVILVIPVINNLYKANEIAFGTCANAGAAGALTSCAFYLMLFEGSHYVMVPGHEESTTAFIWGTMVLVGVITASVLDLIVSAILPKEEAATDTATKDAEGGVGAVVAVDAAFVLKNRRTRVRCGVLIGDFMHNFCDGIFIGTAFSSCSTALAWNITGATILHELAQEVADFVVLTDPKQGALKPLQALALNFLSGTSVLIGCLIVLSADLDNLAIGMILTFGGGIYIQIGLTECMARVYGMASSTKLKAIAILFFILGAIAIGLVLLDHVHCIPESAAGAAGAADPHAGHNHGRL